MGFTWERLSSNAKIGKFSRISQGIYRLSHFPGSPHEDFFVAWLRTGDDSVVSHESALSIYNLTDILPGDVHVIVPRTASRRRRGIRLHTSRLNPGDVTTREGLPVTTIPRTIADLINSGLAYEHIENAIKEALQRGLVTDSDLLDVATTRGGYVEIMIRQVLRSETPL